MIYFYFLLSSLGPFARLALFLFLIALIVFFDLKMFSPNRHAPKMYAEYRRRREMPTPVPMPEPMLIMADLNEPKPQSKPKARQLNLFNEKSEA